jgi:hypothetical protein
MNGNLLQVISVKTVGSLFQKAVGAKGIQFKQQRRCSFVKNCLPNMQSGRFQLLNTNAQCCDIAALKEYFTQSQMTF